MSQSVKVALYARVSTTDQTAENQLLDLRRYAADRKFVIVDEFVDCMSGSLESRPRMNQMMDDARKRKFSAVLVFRFDRFARSVRHLVMALHEFKGLDIAFISYQENIDTSTPLGSAIFTICAAMAELEKSILVERIQSGLNRARQQGRHIGRPKKVIDGSQLERLRKEGLSLREISSRLKIPKSTLNDWIKSFTDKQGSQLRR